MNKQILLITGPTGCGKTMLAHMIRDARSDYQDVEIWDEPALSGKESCKAAIKKHAKTGIAIITSSQQEKIEDKIDVNQIIYMSLVCHV